jgi:hypothetical protein
VQLKLSAALKEYRLLHGAHVRQPGALVYPSSLRYLPAYVLGLLKSTALRWGGAGQQGCSNGLSTAHHVLGLR